MAVILDVVYNHLGPEGNYLQNFGQYFTGRYKTPWGSALNFDGPHSDEVRSFFIQNALTWIDDFHIDALRLDAVHAILDHSPIPFLEELASEVAAKSKILRRPVYLIAESAANDARLVRAPDRGGLGLDAVWNDDFHHSLRALLTLDRDGYYQDFGKLGHLAKAFREGFVYTGEYSPFRLRRHGSPSHDIPAERFVVFTQNHDQVGNRMAGDRWGESVSFEGLKLAAATVILSPFLPLIFMGEEYGETARFPYFVSHTDPDLIEAVRRGRREEFAGFQWRGEIPDPQERGTFEAAKLNHLLKEKEHHRVLYDFYAELMSLRKRLPALARLSKETMEVAAYEEERVLLVRRWSESGEVFMVSNFGQKDVQVSLPIPWGHWHKSADNRWSGPGSLLPVDLISQGKVDLNLLPLEFALYSK
jgi:maltooligosyltrehalose trehalohydrolase